MRSVPTPDWRLVVNMRYVRSLLLVLALLPVAPLSAAERSEGLLFGSVAMDIPAVMHKRLLPLTQYLSRAVGLPVSLKLSPDMAVAIRETSDGTVDISYLTPVAYLKAHAIGGAKLVVKTVTEGKGSFQLMIIVKDGSPIHGVADLKGRTFAFGDKAALLQRAVVVGAGLALEDLRDYKYLGHYDNIVRGVLNGDFDAGIVKDTMAHKWQEKGVRVVYASPDLPPYNIAASGRLSDATVAKLRAAFLALDAAKPGHLQIIQAMDASYSGFADTSDAEYDVVRNLIAPFEK